MSLINDMLKDLDSDNNPAPQEPLPAGLREPEIKKRSPRSLILPGLAVIAVLYGLVVELNILGLMPEKKSAPVDIPQPIALNSKWLTEGPEAVNAKPAEPVPLDKVVLPAQTATAPAVQPASATQSVPAAQLIASAVTPAEIVRDDSSSNDNSTDIDGALAAIANDPAQGTSTVIAADQDNRVEFTGAANFVGDDPAVEKLLIAGDTALMENRLTTPVGDNAYQYFQSALLLQADNARAQTGIAEIQQRYLAWMTVAIDAQKPAAAQQYWQRARSTGVAAQVLQNYRSRIDRITTASSTADTFAGDIATLPPNSTIATINTNTASNTAINTRSTGTITPAAPQNDAMAAARLQEQGLVVGEAAAWRWLNSGQATEQTAVLLAELYAAAGATQKLAQLYQLLDAQQNSAAIYVQAQLLAQQQNFAVAAEQLAAVQYSGAAEQKRMRTLAGFYQQLKNFELALPLYSRLVSIPPANVNDWLGLAVSADAQKMTAVAQNAYQNVLRLTHPDGRIMRFAQQRQQDLSFSTNSR